jgi:hypothetical protein
LDPQLLKALSTNKTSRLGDLKTANAAVFQAIDTGFAQDRKNVLDSLAAAAPDNIKAALSGIDVSKLTGDAPDAAVQAALTAANIDAQTREGIVAAIDATNVFAPEINDPSLPLAANPAIQTQLAKSDLADFAGAAGLKQPASDALLAATDSLDTLDDDVLQALVASNGITEADAKALGLRLSLHHLAGGHADAVQALATSPNGAVTNVKDLMSVPDDQLVALLRTAKVQPEPGTAIEDLAGSIKAKLAAAYPFEALRAQFGKPDTAKLAASAVLLAPLAAQNPQMFSRDFASLNLGNADATTTAQLASAHADIAKLVRHYPGLGLEDAASTGASADIATKISTRLALVDTVMQQNPNAEFLALDYMPDSADMTALKSDGLADADRNAVLKTFKAHQRVFAVTDDALASAKVLEGGYASAIDIAKEDPEVFAARTGLAANRAKSIHDRASDTLSGVSAVVGSFVDVVKGGFGKLGVGNLFGDVSDALKQIDGYADMFGPVDGCNCSDCESILSPSAYFVDLMYFIEQHITTKCFAGALATHELNLRMRRPDLWTLPLTCDNTNTLLPTLQVVNEILEAFIAHHINPALDLGNSKSLSQIISLPGRAFAPSA